ncbi:MAG: glucose/galactose MFS transporter, partial [Bacteroidales bacterium]|nr:glucose/galactose MFS transporter [Bacteroidales bacterium]
MKNKTSPLLIIGLLFFIFGFITWLNSVLVPFLKTACELTNFQSYFVTFAFYIAYFVLAPFASGIIGRMGY